MQIREPLTGDAYWEMLERTARCVDKWPSWRKGERSTRKMARPTNWPDDVPYIDDKVLWLGVSAIRRFNAAKLAALTSDGKAVVLCDNSKPLVVICSYQGYLNLQGAINAADAYIRDHGSE